MADACYVYAVVEGDVPLPRGGPAEGSGALRLVRCRGLAAVTGGVRGNAASVAIPEVLRHESVVEAVRREGPALPVRFGTVFRDERSVASALEERYDILLADLRRLGTRVEVSLTAIWRHAHPADAPGMVDTGKGAGARYLHARAAETRRDDAIRERAREVAADLDRRVAGPVLDRRASLLPTPRVAVRAAYLLDVAGVDPFRSAFEQARGARTDLRLLLTGPWPPYSFVTRERREGAGGSDDRLGALVRLVADEMDARHG